MMIKQQLTIDMGKSAAQTQTRQTVNIELEHRSQRARTLHQESHESEGRANHCAVGLLKLPLLVLRLSLRLAGASCVRFVLEIQLL